MATLARRVALGLGSAVLVLATACSGATPVDCATNDECAAGELCLAGECVPSGVACGADQACPSGQHCCQGTCAAERCCALHSDCIDGYCLDGRCQSGGRPRCPAEPCPTGVCNTDTGTCVECMRHSDCKQPPTCLTGDCIVCGADHTCVKALADCTQSVCNQTNQICAAEAGCRNCLPNTADCGDQVCVGGTCVPCTSTHPCPGGLVCESGNCVIPAGVRCGDNSDCNNKACRAINDPILGLIARCQPCTTATDCSDPSRSGYTCNTPGTDRCAANITECTHDDDCTPPATICDAGRCVPGCTRGSCYEGLACAERVGRCFVSGGGPDVLGTACMAHGDCLSGACWRATINLTDTMICSQPCARHLDCPSGFVCWELGDANMCVPISAAFNTPYPHFDQLPGQTCDGDYFQNHECRTDYCRKTSEDVTAATCMETCGRDSDCGFLPELSCVAGWPLGDDTNGSGATERIEAYGFTELCHAGWGRIGPNLPCATGPQGSVTANDHDLCRSGWCAWTPDRDRPGHCAEPCCSPSDCDPTHPVCKPIDVWDGVRLANETGPYGFQKTCLWREYTGTKEIGEACTADSQCKGEICASASGGGGVCTTTCCTNDDCAGYTFAPVCRRPNPYGGGNGAILYDSAYDQLQLSLGRLVHTGTGTGQAIGMSALCLPP